MILFLVTIIHKRENKFIEIYTKKKTSFKQNIVLDKTYHRIVII